jgi:hypothetical protein
MGLPPDIANLTGPPPGAPSAIPIGDGGGAPGAPPDLGGGGPPPGGPPDLGGGGLPPELMAALSGGPGGPPPGGPPTDGGGFPDDEVGLLRGAFDHLSRYLDVANDDADKAVIAKAIAQIQGVFAKDQKEQEAAGGVTPAHRGMAKALR